MSADKTPSSPLRSRSRWSAFGHAFRGMAVLAREPAGRIHLVAAALVVGMGVGLRIETADWLVLIGWITLVLLTEALNTALERAVDLASPRWHSLARDAKDVAAAAVLISVVGAVVSGAVVLAPYLVK
jgi:diacylglycerol kinase